MNLRSTAVLFRNFGRLEGVLASLKCRVDYRSKRPLFTYLKQDWWQKALQLGTSADHGAGGRRTSKEGRKHCFQVEVTLKTADALLILEAGQLQKEHSR